MKFEAFERTASEYWERVPEAYKRGIDGLVVSRQALRHPSMPDIYTLGECLTESYPSDFGGPETTRSVLMLYYGSFRRLAGLEREFDWEGELWETITHELRHHLESLAAEDALEGVDYAADENFKRWGGEPFDPYFYRSGEPEGERLFRVESELFMEWEYADGEEPDGWVAFDWDDAAYRVAVPEQLGDVCFLSVAEGLDAGPDALTLVLVRRRRLGGLVRDWLARRAPAVIDADAAAEPVKA